MEIRTCSDFLWLPKKINNEWRWFRRSNWIEEWTFGFGMMECGLKFYKNRWKPIRWDDR